MSPGKKYLVLTSLLLLAFASLQAQVLVKAYVDKDNILVGEPIQLSIEARFPLGETVNWFNLDSIPHFEYINKGTRQDTNDVDGKKQIQTITLTSYDTGQWTIPRFTISIDGKNYSSDSLSVKVRYNDGFNAEEDYREIKETEEVSLPFDRKKLYYIIGAVVLLAILLIYLFNRKKKKKESPIVQASVSPYEAAMNAIDGLKKQKPVGQVETKSFYTSLNDILRNYLSEQWKVSTKEKTNEELILQLKSYQLNSEQFTQLAQSLRLADFVKFAKYLPQDSDNEKALEVTESAIKQLHKTIQ
jgi:hypothetical protein